LRLKTLPHQTLTINPDHPIHLAPLTSLHTILTHSIDLLGLTLSYSYPSEKGTATSKPPRTAAAASDAPTSSPQFLAAQLRLLSQSIAEASSILKGPPLVSAADPSWTTRSVAPTHFTPPLPQPHPHHHNHQSGSSSNNTHNNTPPAVPPLSFHLSIQDSSLVLWLRSLEPADAPVNFGTKLALAIGTTRRLEHDESERVFGFCCNHTAHDGSHSGPHGSPKMAHTAQSPQVDVYVREKVRVESADPSLMSLSAKLSALGKTLALARRNLAAVMGTGEEDDDIMED